MDPGNHLVSRTWTFNTPNLSRKPTPCTWQWNEGGGDLKAAQAFMFNARTCKTHGTGAGETSG